MTSQKVLSHFSHHGIGKLIFILITIIFSMLFPINDINSISSVEAATLGLPPETQYAGNDSGLIGDDLVSGVFNIGFSFAYYGNTYTQFETTTNGLVCFGGGATNTWTNTTIPDPAGPNNCIYTFWDDLMSYDSTQPILYRTVGDIGSRMLIVQWTNYGYYLTDLPMGTFQVILYEGSNAIRTQYRQLLTDTRSYGQSATIGLENAGGSAAVQYCFEDDCLDPEQSILWTWNGSNSYNFDSGAAYEGVYLYKDNPPPSVPALISPANGSANISTSPTFSWNSANGANSYNLRVSTNSDLSSPTISQDGLTSTTFSGSGLSVGPTYYWGIEAINAYGNTWSSIWSFTTAAGNSAPNDISLSNNTISAGQPSNTQVGTLSTVDPDVGDTHTYTLVVGGGSSDNGSFSIQGNSLATSTVLSSGSYTIRVRSTDQDGLFVEEIFPIAVTESNSAPTDITLSSTSILENQPTNTVIGAFSTTDPNAGDTFTYTLVSGTGDTDNASFNISGTSLRSNIIFDYEAQNSFTIRVRSTDQGNLFSEKQLNISVTNVIETTATTISSDSPDPSVFGQDYPVTVNVSPQSGAGQPTGTVTVSDGSNSCTISLTAGSGSCNLPSLSPDNVTLTATYLGATYWSNSSDTESHTINKATSLTTITSDNADPSEWGFDYTVNVSVAAQSPGSGIPTGSVTVDDGTNDCQIVLVSGSGSCDLPSPTVTTLTLTATYTGDSNFEASSDTEPHTIEDSTPPTVTIDQATTQTDPTNQSGILFDVVFSENVSGFEGNDVSFTGSTAPGLLVAAANGSGAIYQVSVSGMTDDGIVMVSIPANRAQDPSSNENLASTSIDHSVTYDITNPTVTINRSSTQANPTNSSPITYDVLFSEEVLGFNSDDILIGGMTGTPLITINGGGASYKVEVSGMSDGEIITAEVKENAALDPSGNTSMASTSADNNVTYDTSPLQVLDAGVIGNPGIFVLKEIGTYLTKFTEISVEFDSDAYNPPGNSDEDDVTNPANYYLIQPGNNTVFEVSTCEEAQQIIGTEPVDDFLVPIGPVTYENNAGAGPFIATVVLNNGNRLSLGQYRFLICGSTTLMDLAHNPLNDGVDIQRDFVLQRYPDELPLTGFPIGSISFLPEQTPESVYSDTGLTLSLPTLGVSTAIIGVPLEDNGWNTAWLGNYAGYLEGSAFPTWDGNTVITGHVWTATNQPGIFANLHSLRYGDEIQINAWGREYTYVVRSNNVYKSENVYSVMQSESLDWLTLVTCDSYDPDTNTFINRRVVRAVLISAD